MTPFSRALRDPARWPSTQRASQMLAVRCAAGLRLRAARQQLKPFTDRYERKAA